MALMELEDSPNYRIAEAINYCSEALRYLGDNRELFIELSSLREEFRLVSRQRRIDGNLVYRASKWVKKVKDLESIQS